MLTRFTEPEEILGPLDLRSLEYVRRRGPMQEADIVFLDEVFRASSSILNALLGLLRESRILTVGSAQELPGDSSLAAFCDQFVVRFWSGNVADEHLGELLETAIRGVRRQSDSAEDVASITTPSALICLNKALTEVRMGRISAYYRGIVTRIRAGGIHLSDRRVVRILKFVAAAALLRGADEADPADLWVCKHIWNTAGEIPFVRDLIDDVLSRIGPSSAVSPAGTS